MAFWSKPEWLKKRGKAALGNALAYIFISGTASDVEVSSLRDTEKGAQEATREGFLMHLAQQDDLGA